MSPFCFILLRHLSDPGLYLAAGICRFGSVNGKAALHIRSFADFFQVALTAAHSAAFVGAEGNHALAGKVIALQKGGIVKYSPSLPFLENTGLNAIQKCVLCTCSSY